jgi:GTPase
MRNELPQVVIVGRANVGKSTLFNRLIEKNKALVSGISGTTRDRNIDVVDWQGAKFTIIDTGGLDINQKGSTEIEENIVKQAKSAIKIADLILFLVDIKAGVMPADKELAKEIVKKRLKGKTILVGNKADSLRWRQASGELYSLNLGEPETISAANGSGCGDLLDLIVKRIPKSKNVKPEDEKKKIKVAIIGKPNVGKSSLLNSILGEERVIVTDIPHTTRESHDTEFIYNDYKFILIDTAGLRKKGKIRRNDSLTRKSVDRSLKTIKSADVVLFITEVQKRIDSQDKKVTQAILENSKSLVIVANKWDLIPDKDTNTIAEYVKYYNKSLPYLWWAPIIFISAKTKQRSKKVLDMVLDIKKARETEITKKELERFLKNRIKTHPPAKGRGLKNPYIYKLEQTGINPPRFTIFVNDPTILHFSYIRFLQNGLRDKYNIVGTPIQIETEKWSRELEKDKTK